MWVPKSIAVSKDERNEIVKKYLMLLGKRSESQLSITEREVRMGHSDTVSVDIIILYNKKSKKSTRISWYKINVISYQHLPVKGLGISAFREINLISTST